MSALPRTGIPAGESRKTWDSRRLTFAMHSVPAAHTTCRSARQTLHGQRLADGAVSACNWAMNWILTLYIRTTSDHRLQHRRRRRNGAACTLHWRCIPTAAKHNVSSVLQPAAFANPPVVTQVDKAISSPLGGGNTQFPGRNEATRFFAFQIISNGETTEVLNLPRGGVHLTNTPAFAQPGKRFSG